MQYCNSLTEYSRLETREVPVGGIAIGGKNPIRIQSMTTAKTMDTEATVAETIRMIDAGCELVRITAPSIKEAENLQNIKDELHRRGYDVPLVADIHFTPNAAEAAARIVEKVRINPGNYTDRKNFKIEVYTPKAFQEEIDKIRDRFTPLLRICKRRKTALRIGVNHGSLSDRIMSRYGDTPLGMVESAMEFVRICEKEKFYHIVLSMKSSNPIVMIQANRLLAATMIENGQVYPMHLGVTEAGEGEGGRIKSAIGIGALLEDGIGDTIRVSLTEKPENEIPVARAIVSRYSNKENHVPIEPLEVEVLDSFKYLRRITAAIMNVGGDHLPKVIIDISRSPISRKELTAVGYRWLKNEKQWQMSDQTADYIFAGNQKIGFELPKGMSVIQNFNVWKSIEKVFPLFSMKEYINAKHKSDELNFVKIDAAEINSELIDIIRDDATIVIILETNNSNGMVEQRRFFFQLIQMNITAPIIIKRNYSRLDAKQLLVDSSIDIGALCIDGLGDGVWLEGNQAPEFINKTSFGILQATRTRITKTEYISCPSCGRTQFNLEDVGAKIREQTEHLKGLKIGIMGCIVNGPGEMADADYGYVGTGGGKITLYKGQEVVRKNIPETEAVEALVELIKNNGDWVEKLNVES